MALGTIIRDVYSNDERKDMRKVLQAFLGGGWNTAGIYCVWEPDTHDALYLGLAKNLPDRFANHNGLKGTPGKGNKAKEVDTWFATHERLGYSIIVQSDVADDATEGYTKRAEGQLIKGHEKAFGKIPPWNNMGGSVDGAAKAGDLTGAWFDFLTGRHDSLLVARRTIRQLDDDATAEGKELDIMMARTQLSLAQFGSETTDHSIVKGLEYFRDTPVFGRTSERHDELIEYLHEPAPHPELSD